MPERKSTFCVIIRRQDHMPAKILIVEDHSDSREILRMQIQYLGYEVIEAGNGMEAIEKAVAENPDLIIMDLGLPGINGFETTIRIKQKLKTAHIPIIAYTAWKEEDYKGKALEAGMVEFLQKPALPAAFREVLQRLLQGGMEEGRKGY
jgi:two-component system cell cycle response regulator DivK